MWLSNPEYSLSSTVPKLPATINTAVESPCKSSTARVLSWRRHGYWCVRNETCETSSCSNDDSGAQWFQSLFQHRQHDAGRLFTAAKLQYKSTLHRFGKYTLSWWPLLVRGPCNSSHLVCACICPESNNTWYVSKVWAMFSGTQSK